LGLSGPESLTTFQRPECLAYDLFAPLELEMLPSPDRLYGMRVSDTSKALNESHKKIFIRAEILIDFLKVSSRTSTALGSPDSAMAEAIPGR